MLARLCAIRSAISRHKQTAARLARQALQVIWSALRVLGERALPAQDTVGPSTETQHADPPGAEPLAARLDRPTGPAAPHKQQECQHPRALVPLVTTFAQPALACCSVRSACQA